MQRFLLVCFFGSLARSKAKAIGIAAVHSLAIIYIFSIPWSISYGAQYICILG